MNNRIDALTQQILQKPPSWLRALGAPPAEGRHRATWLAAVGTIAAYRDRYQISEHRHPRGTASPANPNQRVARRGALAASRQARATTAPRAKTPSTAPSAVGDSPSL